MANKTPELIGPLTEEVQESCQIAARCGLTRQYLRLQTASAWYLSHTLRDARTTWRDQLKEDPELYRIHFIDLKSRFPKK